jgi:hypothetical protein
MALSQLRPSKVVVVKAIEAKPVVAKTK